MDFRTFLFEADRNMADVEKTLKRLPAKHRSLLRGWKYKFQPGNQMKGDPGYVGLMDPEKKTIILAAPWFYSREFTLLHELAHIIWSQLITKDQKEKWNKISKATKNTSEKDPEELFCFAYARFFSEDKPGEYHDHAGWHRFIGNL